MGVVSLIVSVDGQDSIRNSGQIKLANFQCTPSTFAGLATDFYSNGSGGGRPRRDEWTMRFLGLAIQWKNQTVRP